ncbi:GNAT family N-acetyltransferase [Candidatus Woesearchaeota archaeon]|nr:GNAT family N-acetyltransferase [Candidatus Woesearchaeota archaeon]
MKIRRATRKDISVLTDFWYEEERFTKKFDKTTSLRRDAKKRIHDFLKKALTKKNYRAFIAQDKNKVVGVIQGEIKKGYFVHNTNFIGHYSTMLVKKEYRAKGIATELFKAMTNWFESKNIKLVDLYVHSGNKIALEMYKKLGFTEILKLMKKEI